MPDLRTHDQDSATLRGSHHTEIAMGRPLTKREMQYALEKGWTRWHTAERYETTLGQVSAAEARHGVVLHRPPDYGRAEIDEAALYRRAAEGALLYELAEEADVSPSTITRRLRSWAVQQVPPQPWPPGGGPLPVEELLVARRRLLEVNARCGLTSRGRYPSGSSWADAVAEAGGDLEGELAGANESQRVRRWAAGGGGVYPKALPRWKPKQQEAGAVLVVDRLCEALGENLRVPLYRRSAASLLLLERYAQDDALDALETPPLDPSRRFHQLRAEAAEVLGDLVQGPQQSSTRSADRWREVIGEVLNHRTSDGAEGEGPMAQGGANLNRETP